MARVTIDDFRKEYGSLIAADDISVTIEDGELAVLVGPSGCGKTTTLRTIAGLETPTSGIISFDDVDVTDTSPQNRDISMVFQNLSLYPHMTAFENVAFPLRADGAYSEGEIETQVDQIARTVDCDGFLDQRVVELSGGQQQRVALARALVREPEVFLMDEPFSDLDELLKRRLRSEVVRIQKELGITMVHVTHDQEEAMTMGDKLVVMNDGEIVQTGDPDTIFNRPSELFVALFIGSPQMNRFNCTVESRSVLACGETRFELSDELAAAVAKASGDAVTLCVRPQHLRWTDDPADEELAVRVHVEVLEQVGTEDVIRCRTPDDTEVTAVVPSNTRERGDEGYLVMDESQVHLFDGHDGGAGRLN
jgi:multiple sugar transport system ATP-binding protein